MGAGAAEHLKTLCCLGLPSESAMIAIVPLLHEIIPHGWMRICLFSENCEFITSRYWEHPDSQALFREQLWKFLDDPTALASLAMPAMRAVGIGWTLHRQGYGYLETAYYREIEAPLDACWILDAMVGERGRSYAGMQLTRPRSARPFTVEDVRRLEPLRPWLAHALRPKPSIPPVAGVLEHPNLSGAASLNGQMILTPDGRLTFHSTGADRLCAMLNGDNWSTINFPKNRCIEVPLPVQKLVRQIVDASNGKPSVPPRLQLSTAYGIFTLEAQWLVSSSASSAEVARSPKDCLIAVTIELHEHALARAARILREKGATPAQVKTGVQLAMGKTKQAIADEFGVQLSSVASLAKKLYQTLDVHNAAELGLKIWLDGRKAV